jgi:hypothetical protein
MQIEVEKNPNCGESSQFVFHELEAPRALRAIRVLLCGRDAECDILGVKRGGELVPACAVKVSDSGAGFAYLIYGGEWGIRLRPSAYAEEPWDFSNRHQWGEPFKIYGGVEDLIYADYLMKPQ